MYMWPLEIFFALGIVVGTVLAISADWRNQTDYRLLAVPVIFLVCGLAALYQHVDSGHPLFSTSSNPVSLVGLAAFSAALLSLLVNIDRLRFPIDELLYTVQIGVGVYLTFYLFDTTLSYGFILGGLILLIGLLLPVMFLRSTNNTARLFLTILYVCVTSGIFLVLLTQVPTYVVFLPESVTAFDLIQAIFAGWVLVGYLVPLMILSVILIVLPNPQAWSMVGGNIYHYFVFTGTSHRLFLPVLSLCIIAALHVLTILYGVYIAVIYVMVCANLLSFYVHKKMRVPYQFTPVDLRSVSR